MKAAHRRLLTDLLALPTSPFNEQHVISYIGEWVRSRPGLRLRQDRFGNLQVHLQDAAGGRGLRATGETPAPHPTGETPVPHPTGETPVPHPTGETPVPHPTGETPVPHPTGETPVPHPLVLAAHMDHPGFEVERMVRPGVVRALWRGGVAPEYFPGAKVRFWAEGAWVRGRIERMHVGDDRGRRRVQWVNASVRTSVPAGAIGMWDFPDPSIRGSRLYARGCDDVAGVAAVLAAMDELASRPGPPHVIAMLNRAEEVGFVGAMAACREGTVPRHARMISVECSSELAGGRMGEGPILRVGDLTTIFTPELTASCRRVAEELAQRRRGFRFQRKLMDGGTCEASAFLGYGYATSGLCIALGNYHNMDRRRKRIGPEFVDLNDWQGLVDWFVALGVAEPGNQAGDAQLSTLLEGLYARWAPLLASTAGRMRLAGTDVQA